jgi:phage-related tail protein
VCDGQKNGCQVSYSVVAGKSCHKTLGGYKMTSLNVDLSSAISAQIFATLTEEDRQKLFVEAIDNIIDGDSLKKMAREQVMAIAKEEIQRLFSDNSEVRQKVKILLDSAFVDILSSEDDVIKTRLVKGILNALTKERY